MCPARSTWSSAPWCLLHAPPTRPSKPCGTRGQAGDPGLHCHAHDQGNRGQQGRAVRARHLSHHRVA
eukprot:14123130-Alexandrium_andersonii.AAC.1